jgi:cyclopropane fatty-acyl-phospholipid synthase-like methyltransferase
VPPDVTPIPRESPVGDYDTFYRGFDTPLMRQVRREAYGEDIGQHSWVRADDLRKDVDRLALSKSSRLVDLGCGPCGPVTFVVTIVGCRATGVELSESALRVGRARAAALGVEERLSFEQADLNGPLPLASQSFDAAMSLDVVLHLRDRLAFFREVARLLSPAGRFLFTDAGVVTGSVSSEEVRERSVHGFAQFVAPGWNERLLGLAGLRLLETEDRTSSALENASGRLSAMHAHRVELEQMSGPAEFERQRRYLETVVELSRRRALSRMMYLADAPRA